MKLLVHFSLNWMSSHHDAKTTVNRKRKINSVVTFVKLWQHMKYSKYTCEWLLHCTLYRFYSFVLQEQNELQSNTCITFNSILESGSVLLKNNRQASFLLGYYNMRNIGTEQCSQTYCLGPIFIYYSESSKFLICMF